MGQGEGQQELAATQFLRNRVAAVPYIIHTVLTDLRLQFTNRKQNRHAFEHIFDASATTTASRSAHRGEHPWTMVRSSE